MEGLKPCKCGSKRLILKPTPLTDGEGSTFCIECLSCGARSRQVYLYEPRSEHVALKVARDYWNGNILERTDSND